MVQESTYGYTFYCLGIASTGEKKGGGGGIWILGIAYDLSCLKKKPLAYVLSYFKKKASAYHLSCLKKKALETLTF